MMRSEEVVLTRTRVIVKKGGKVWEKRAERKR
jgi:hypothetical protein